MALALSFMLYWEKLMGLAFCWVFYCSHPRVEPRVASNDTLQHFSSTLKHAGDSNQLSVFQIKTHPKSTACLQPSQAASTSFASGMV